MAKWKEVEKDLVAEQPGLGLSFIGLFFAFFMGLAIRAAVSPERVEERLLQATQKIHKDLDIQFKSAYVSFARGLWPDLSVVIEGVTIQSNKTCYLAPLAEINEIRLPLSLRHLFRGQILIHEVLADEVNLSLRTAFSKCDDENPSQEASAPMVPENPTATSPPSAAPAPTAEGFQSQEAKSENAVKPVIADFENVRRKNPIDTVQISSLKIHYLPLAFTSFYIQDFQALLKAEEPRWISLTGRLNLEAENFLRESASHADIQIDSVEGENPQVKAIARGVWREGQYHVLGIFDSKKQILDFETSAHHLPLSQIIPILKKYRWIESEFNGRQAWVSGQIKLKGPISELEKTPAKLTGLKLEGEVGEVSCNQAEILSWQPLQFKPIDFEIRGLNIKEFLTFLNRPHPTPALGNLGYFSGTAHFVSPEQLALRGDYSGLEFIFSNRGTRQIQALSLVSGELELNKDKWSIQLDRVKPAEGFFDGKVEMVADKDFKDLQIRADLKEVILSPQVQNLMTGGGHVGALSGQVKVHLKNAEISNLNGQLKWDKLLVEGMKMDKPKLSLETKGREILMTVGALDLEFDRHNPFAGPVFTSIFDETKEDKVSLKGPTALIRTEKFTSLSWDRFQAASNLGLIKSHGRWNENSELSGEFQIQNKRKQTWLIQGNRNQPKMVLKDL